MYSADSNLCTRTSLNASKIFPKTWYANPVELKRISPYEAIITPITINEIFLKVRRFGFSIDKHQPARRTATGVVALHQKVSVVDMINVLEETKQSRYL